MAGEKLMTDALKSTARDSVVIELASEIVSAFVRNNSVSAAELPDLIRSVHASLSALGTPDADPSR